MAKRYFILAVRTDGVWAQEFGDYDRETVASELQDQRDHFIRVRDLKILTVTDRQASSDAAIAKLNLALAPE